jgi:hypothetical protein
LSPTLAKDGSKAPVTVFACDFETWSGGSPDIPVGNPDGFVGNTGWIDSLYGFPLSGSSWAYSWAQGDTLTTPGIQLLNSNSMLSFWYMCELDSHPMDLEVYCNGMLVFAHYGFTHMQYQQALVDLSFFDGQIITLDFVGLISDFYGQCLEDVEVVSEEYIPPPPSEYPILNMTYQMDIQDSPDYEGVCLDTYHYTMIEYMYVQDNSTDLFIELEDAYSDWLYCYYGYYFTCPWFLDCTASPCCDSEGFARLIVYKNGVPIFDSYDVDPLDWDYGGFCYGTGMNYIANIGSAGPQDQIKVFYSNPAYEFCQESCCCENPDSLWDDERDHAWRLFRQTPEGDVNIAVDGCDGCMDGVDCHCPTSGMHGPWYIDECTGCGVDDCVCSDDLTQWVPLTGRMNGNAPGVCQWFSGELEVPTEVGEDPEWLCIRLVLDTKSALYDYYQAANPGFTGWHEIDGIGMHIHQLSLDGILNPDSHPEYEGWDSILYNFEDGTMNGCLGPALQNIDPLAEGWWKNNVQCDDCSYDPGFGMVRDTYYGGEYWEQTGPFTFEQYYPPQFIDNYLLWETEIEDCYEAYFSGEWGYMLGEGQEARVEFSADGGENWYIIDRAINHKPQILGSHSSACIDEDFWNQEDFPDYSGYWLPIEFDLSPWAGSSVMFRVRVINTGYWAVPSYNGYRAQDMEDVQEFDGGWVIAQNFSIMGKQDFLPPTVAISLSGNSVGPGLYAGPVTVTITADDNKEVGEIHYILDGTETVVSGDKATFKVSEDGDHTVEAWAVDATGNVGGRTSTGFSIDNSPPTVALNAPEPGLYLFGNKLLSMSKPFIIGAFTAESTADDAQGVAVVKFMLNGEVVGEDTEAPYDAYIAVKNMGAATLKAVAEDGVGNTAEDSMDITYYKFL